MKIVESTRNSHQEKTLADYLEIVRRYKWLIVVTAVVVPLVAYLVSAQQPKVYQGTSEVYLNSQDLGSVLTGVPATTTYTDPVRYGETQAALARVPAVTRSAIARAGVQMNPSELIGHSYVSPKGNTDLLAFAVRDGDPDIAARLSAAYAAAFKTYKHRIETASFEQARKELQRRLAELRRAGASDTTTYRELIKKSQDLRTLEFLQSPTTVVKAAAGAGQIEPNPTRNAVFGAVLGLLLGIGAALALNALDRRIRDAEEVEAELRAPLLARLPRPRRRGESLLIVDRAADEVTESVGRLRTNFDFANSEVQAKVVMVTSAGAREGKSTTVANLAVALARTGRHVILVDLDLRRPSLGHLFGLANRAGVTDIATGAIDLDGALNAVVHAPARSWPPAAHESEPGSGLLEVLTSGRTRVDPSDFVETPALAELLRLLRTRADIVLVDSPPVLAAGDAVALTAKVDAVVLVHRLGTLTHPTAREVARILDRSPAPTLGFIATGSPHVEGYYGYQSAETADGKVMRLPRQDAKQTASGEMASPSAGPPARRWSRPSSSR